MTMTSRLLLIPLLVVTVILLPKARAQHRNSTTWDLLLPLANNIPLNNATEYIREVDPKRRLLWNVVKLDSKHRLLWDIVSMCNSTTWELLPSLATNVGLDIRELDSKRHLLWNTVSICRLLYPAFTT
ncbi:hypothetical protein Tco_1151996 [Tanacetum coccineum]